MGGLIFDASGKLYGVTNEGGAYGYGTVFQLRKNSSGTWTEKVLHSFDKTEGWNPTKALVMDASGNLYGTTYNSGAEPATPGNIKSSILFSRSFPRMAPTQTAA